MEWTLLTLLPCLLASMVHSAPPYRFISQDKEYNLLPGDDVVIECSVEGLMSAIPLLWMNQSFAFGMNDGLFAPSDRASLEGEERGDVRTYRLSIDNVQPVDEGVYECQVPASVRKRQQHSVIVNIPPVLYTDTEEREFVLRLGATLPLSCWAEGKPKPTVKWDRLDGRSLPSGETTLEAESFTLMEVDEYASGTYRCTAANGFGEDKFEEFMVHVHFSPRVEVNESIVHTGPGHDVSITCTFSGNPSVQVMWQYEGEDVNYNEIKVETELDKKRQNTYLSTLTITNVQTEQLGTYTCKGENSLDSTEKDITLSAFPHSLLITSDPKGTFSDQYNLEWTLSSVPDPIDCDVTLSESNTTEDGEVIQVPLGTASVPAKISNIDHPQSYKITDLHENGMYVARIQCRNQYGSTETSELEFYTPLDVNIAPPPPTFKEEVVEEEEPTEEQIVPSKPDIPDDVDVDESEDADDDDEDDDDDEEEDNTINDEDADVKIGESVGEVEGGVAMATPMVGLMVAMVMMMLC